MSVENERDVRRLQIAREKADAESADLRERIERLETHRAHDQGAAGLSFGALERRVERLEAQRVEDVRATDAELGRVRRRVEALEIVLDDLQEDDEEPPACGVEHPGVGAVCTREPRHAGAHRGDDRHGCITSWPVAPPPATPTEPDRTAWVEHVMQLAREYAAHFGQPRGHNLDRVARDALHAAVIALAAGRDPREVKP
jgi:hypothetical protein